LSIDVPTVECCTHGRHKRTTTTRVTGRGVFRPPFVTTTNMVGGMRQHEEDQAESSLYTEPARSGPLNTLPPSENGSEHVSRFCEPHCKRDNGGEHQQFSFCKSRCHMLLPLLRNISVGVLAGSLTLSVVVALGMRCLSFFGVGVARACTVTLLREAVTEGPRVRRVPVVPSHDDNAPPPRRPEFARTVPPAYGGPCGRDR